MKKCPECGNPSYDGAPVCGNCGYKFPKPKTKVIKEESIFDKAPEPKKPSTDESTVNILKEKKLVIGAILIITLIVICGIVLTGSHHNNNSSVSSNDLIKVSEISAKIIHRIQSINSIIKPVICLRVFIG